MKPQAKKYNYKKIALIFSLCFLIVWSILGTGTSIAWFGDSSPEINNIFHIADFDITISHRLTDGAWEEVDSTTKVFDEEALFEPGYVQIVYLKVENTGDREFKFNTAVNVNGCTAATNVFGQTFLLQDYLKFGVTISSTEEEMKNRLKDREIANLVANMPLHNYTNDGEITLLPNEEKFIALVVRMPETVNNIANYREDAVPKVELGITVKAEQV